MNHQRVGKALIKMGAAVTELGKALLDEEAETPKRPAIPEPPPAPPTELERARAKKNLVSLGLFPNKS